MAALHDESWYQGLEGRDQGPADAAHWVQVYMSLLRTLSTIAMEVPEARPRVEQLRERLRYWQGVLSSRSAQHVPPGDATERWLRRRPADAVALDAQASVPEAG